jgi:hypothetical protein
MKKFKTATGTAYKVSHLGGTIVLRREYDRTTWEAAYGTYDDIGRWTPDKRFYCFGDGVVTYDQATRREALGAAIEAIEEGEIY